MRRRWLAWWSKYAYILTTAFSVGIAISAIIQFIFANADLGMTPWWGTDVPFQGCEGTIGCPRLEIPEEGFFHPGPGEGF